jgi:6-phosphogluconate dehydrogenase
MNKSDIGIYGMGVMGQNLALNMDSKGFKTSVYNKRITGEKDLLNRFLKTEAKKTKISGFNELEEFVGSIAPPRKIMLMVKAGPPVDSVIDELLPLLEKGDIIIDGGNSNYMDTSRRTRSLEKKSILFVGMGVSGGEEGARNGPSLMPGGNNEAWKQIKPIYKKIAAETFSGDPCCKWIGPEGAGHFVKMVHNGIEYGDMQLICEAYQIMKDLLGMSADEMHEVFKEWNEGELDSYLIEITRDILGFKDEDGGAMVDKILDTAGQKGTGKWTGIAALDLGIPLTLIGESVFARCLSAIKDKRVAAAKVLSGPQKKFDGDKKAFIEAIRQALYASKIVSYAQGYTLMQAAAQEHGWNLNYGGIALMWRGGCIIRSVFLSKIKAAFDAQPDLSNLLLDPFFKKTIDETQQGWRTVCAEAIKNGIPAPAFTSALAYYDGFRSERLPANLLQAQRDYFGAHTYERIDKPRGEFFHTNWTGRGGSTSASTYDA